MIWGYKRSASSIYGIWRFFFSFCPSFFFDVAFSPPFDSITKKALHWWPHWNVRRCGHSYLTGGSFSLLAFRRVGGISFTYLLFLSDMGLKSGVEGGVGSGGAVWAVAYLVYLDSSHADTRRVCGHGEILSRILGLLACGAVVLMFFPPPFSGPSVFFFLRFIRSESVYLHTHICSLSRTRHASTTGYRSRNLTAAADANCCWEWNMPAPGKNPDNQPDLAGLAVRIWCGNINLVASSFVVEGNLDIDEFGGDGTGCGLVWMGGCVGGNPPPVGSRRPCRWEGKSRESSCCVQVCMHVK